MYVSKTITFESIDEDVRPEIRVKFLYEGHRVKVKVTGAIKVKSPYSRNVKLRSAITPVL